MNSLGIATGWMTGLMVLPLMLFSATPASSNYTLKSYDVGSGGSDILNSTNYQLNGVVGSQTGTTSPSSAGTVLNTGTVQAGDAAVPPAPGFSNPAGYYDRLQVIINTGGNPADTRYLIAVSSDNFVTSRYVQTDNSLGISQAVTNYQTYAAWGGADGFLVTGLVSSTIYQVRLKALQGGLTGTAFGPQATAATTGQSISVSLSTTLTAVPPYSIGFGPLTAGTVTDGNADAVISVTSNAASGGVVYVRGANGGLSSVAAGYTLATSDADLSLVPGGYGAQVLAVSQTSGGPFAKRSPFDGSGDSVGALTASLRPIISSNGPVTAGSGTIRLKAKAAGSTVSANDYTDTVTFVVAMNF